MYNLGYSKLFGNVWYELTKFNFILKLIKGMFYTILHKTSRRNYCTGFPEVHFNIHSQRSHKIWINACTTWNKFAISCNYMLESSGTKKGNFSTIFPKEIIYHLSAIFLYHLLGYLYQFSLEKQELTLAYHCTKPALFILIILFFAPFNLRAEIKSLRKEMYSYCPVTYYSLIT